MPLGLIARLRLHGRPAVMAAAGVIAVQAFLAGLALAQAALLLTPGLADFVVICHGNGVAVLDDKTAPAPAPNPHPCCDSCTAAAPPATLPAPLSVSRVEPVLVLKVPVRWTLAPPIAARAVRAGLSQGPPGLA
jgi:hypothetical protein